MQAARRGGGDAGGLELRVQRVARERAAAAERVIADLARTLDDALVEVEVALKAALLPLQGARAVQRQQPAQVGRRDEVQGAAQRPAAHDAPFGQRALDRRLVGAAHALADAPQRAEIVLRLHGELRGDRLLGVGEGICGEAMSAQALAQDVEAGRLHAGGSPGAGTRTIVSSRRSSIVAASLQRPVCTGEVWIIVLRGAVSQ